MASAGHERIKATIDFQGKMLGPETGNPDPRPGMNKPSVKMMAKLVHHGEADISTDRQAADKLVGTEASRAPDRIAGARGDIGHKSTACDRSISVSGMSRKSEAQGSEHTAASTAAIAASAPWIERKSNNEDDRAEQENLANGPVVTEQSNAVAETRVVENEFSQLAAENRKAVNQSVTIPATRSQ